MFLSKFYIHFKTLKFCYALQTVAICFNKLEALFLTSEYSSAWSQDFIKKQTRQARQFTMAVYKICNLTSSTLSLMSPERDSSR